MDSQIDALARKILISFSKKPKDQRLLVGLAGPPGCGKSTVVDPLIVVLNKLLSDLSRDHYEVPAPQAVTVPLDGWHYSRAELDEMPDPVEAHWRRGAAFTFNQPLYQSFVEQLRKPLSKLGLGESIPFPTFLHHIKDPVAAGGAVLPQDRIVIIEGLYTHYTQPGWKTCAEMMDLRVWIEVEPEVSRMRVAKRNFAAGIFNSWEETLARVDAVDMANGVDVRRWRLEPTDMIHSV